MFKALLARLGAANRVAIPDGCGNFTHCRK